MITVIRSRHMDASPERIFTLLSDPDLLLELLPRVRRVDFRERGQNHARITTYMDLKPLPLGEIRSEGDVSWREGRELIFRSQRPIPVEARWTLTPNSAGTHVNARLSIELAGLLGPLAAFVPERQVQDIVGPNIEAALERVARRVAE